MPFIPRLLIELVSLKECAYDLRYHAKLQGFVYNLLRGTPYEGTHNKNSYKNFCFSNIEPPFDMHAGDARFLVVSSPDPGLVEAFAGSIEKIKTANIGDMSFAVKSVKKTQPRIGSGVRLVTRTPIIIRIPRQNFEKYGIKRGDYDYVYWRKDLSFDAFLRQLEENLLKKYQEYTGAKVDESRYLPLFQQFLFKKQVCNHVIIDGREFKVFGSLWEFAFDHLTREQWELLQFGLDSGFGERNSLGFGFVDLKRHFSGGRKNHNNLGVPVKEGVHPPKTKQNL